MTIEEEFFKAFNIAKTSFDFTCNKKQCDKKRLSGRFACLECDNEAKKEVKVYPQITDRMLLELIWYLSGQNNTTFQDLKNKILKECIEMSDCKELKQQVKSLFEKGAKDEQ